MQEFYDITVAGVKRSLPIVPISDTMSIAGFVIFGDTEVVENGFFNESAKRSAPYFDLKIDGITLLDTAF